MTLDEHTMLTFTDLLPLTADLPPIVMLSVSDSLGAFGAAYNLHRCLAAAGANVKTLVMTKTSDAVGVLEVPRGRNLSVISTAMQMAALHHYPARPSGFELFSLPRRSLLDLTTIDVLRTAGIVHLHWVAGMVEFPQAQAVFQNKPVVWTLHDMNPFTGGCHYTSGCYKYKSGGCAACPQLGPADNGSDLAASTFAHKRNSYKNINLTAVTPSKWLSGCASESILMNKACVVTIPNGIDLETFIPCQREKARAALDLPLDRKIVIFGANGNNRRNKGLYLLTEGLKRLQQRWQGELPLLLIFGNLVPPELLPSNYDCRQMGHIDDKSKLAVAYAAADVFVLPSFEDNLPSTLLESQACGTPTVAFSKSGGATDIIQDGVTGYLAKHPGLPLDGGIVPSQDGAYCTFAPESIEELAAKIQNILELPSDEYATMRSACREHALAEYSLVLQAERYLRLYRSILHLPPIFAQCSFETHAAGN